MHRSLFLLTALGLTLALGLGQGTTGRTSPPADPIKVLIITGDNVPSHDWQGTTKAMQEVLDVLHRLRQRIRRYVALEGSALVAVALGIYAGLRAGEIFGLRWRDVSFSSRLLTVSRSFSRTTKSGLTRHIPLNRELSEYLTAWRPRCPKSPEDLVCPSLDGKSWTIPKQAPRDLPRLYLAASLPVPSAPWHCLRHTFASLFMMSGGNILTLRTLMGHSDVSQTQAYAHLAPQFLASEIERIQLRNREE